MDFKEREISVVVPAYNAEYSIPDCIDSLLAQTLDERRYRIIAIDNHSKDNTLNVLDRFGDRISILSEAKRGPSAARNRGILSTNSEIVAFIDADCVADSTWLANLISPLSNNEVGMVGGRILAKSSHEPIRRFGEKIHDHQKAIEISKPPYVISMNSAIRRQVVIEAGLFDTAFLRGEDVDLSWRVIAKGYSLCYQQNAIVYHDNESNLSGLLKEGCQHGYYGVKVKQHHSRYLAQSGRQRNIFGNLRSTLANLSEFLKADKRRKQYLYETVFSGGKTLGSFVGSLRFGFFEI